MYLHLIVLTWAMEWMNVSEQKAVLFFQNSTPFLGLGKAGGEWWETRRREKGDGKFENEDKCFKVCVFVEKGDVVGESWCYHCHMNSVLFYGFVPLAFVTSGVFCMVEIGNYTLFRLWWIETSSWYKCDLWQLVLEYKKKRKQGFVRLHIQFKKINCLQNT